VGVGQDIISRYPAIDATLLEANGKWWLFTTIKERNSWDILNLYSG
jgi:hypothetical protein